MPPSRNQRASQIRALHVWLNDAGLRGLSAADMLSGLAERLNTAGFDLARCHMSMSTLHPLVRAYGYTWRAAGVVQPTEFAHNDADPVPDSPWQVSPFRYMLERRAMTLRRRLTGPEAVLDFPVLQEFAGLGLTDWYGALHSFGKLAPGIQGGEIGMVSSWATARPGGLSDEELAALDEVLSSLALAVKASTAYGITDTLLGAYLGRDAARHVMTGDVRLGDVHRLEAALLFADLRDFTSVSDRSAPGSVIGALHVYFEAIGRRIEAAGGEILKFVGDGLLAVFPLDEGDPGAACRSSLSAAAAALEDIRLINAARNGGEPVMGLDIALHKGTVLYGNVGTPTRLDFTVVGPAVNEISRLELMGRSLGRNLLVSAAFADALAPEVRAQLVSLGSHSLAGVAGAREILTLP